MKRVAYLFFICTLLSSCGAWHPANYAKIEFRDSKSGHFLLQSIADSSIRALDYRTDSLQTIPFQNISRIFLQGDPNSAEWIGFLSGTVIGYGYMVMVTTSMERSDGLAGVLALPFMLAGLLTGYIIGNQLHEIDLYSPEGKARLYKGIEPNKDIWPERGYIK
jgi:hypothetical protein